MCGSAREIFVRSMNAIVYMMRATGIIRIQRRDTPAGGASLSGFSSRVLFWVIRVDGDACVYQQLTVTEPRRHEPRRPASHDAERRGSIDSIQEQKSRSWRENSRALSPATRSGRRPFVRKRLRP